jgi:pyruvate,water dikinase
LPRYRELVADGERRLAAASPDELCQLVDDIMTHAGGHFWDTTFSGGWGWKCEALVGKFFAKHLAGCVEGTHQTLLSCLRAPRPGDAHAVQTLDWHRPTFGELAIDGPEADPARHAKGRADRERTEAACRAALAGTPRRLARFDQLLAFAQRYTAIHDEMLDSLTIGWPLLRRALLRLGERARERGVIARADDVFFLECSELAATTSLAKAVTARRRAWEQSRRLAAPLSIGTPLYVPYYGGDLSKRAVPPGAVAGMPASPGRAAGPARVVRCAEDFARVRPGDVLVAPVTTPAFTPLFGRAAAVVTDGGSLTAHASLVAREYGIPAVVATGDMTRRVRDGQVLTVDGTAGWVEVPGA